MYNYLMETTPKSAQESKETIRQRTNIHPHIQRADRKLNAYIPAIEQGFDSTIERVTATLPVTDVDVDIMYRDLSKFALAVHGYAPSRNKVDIYLDVNHPDFEELLEKELPQTLAHELNHAKRWEGPGFGSTLFDVLIAEGLALYFEQEAIEGIDPSRCTFGLTPEQIGELTEKAKKEFDHPLTELFDKYHDKWFWSGSETEGIPPAAGYAIGYVLVGNYLKANPDKKASSLVLEPPETFRPTA